MVGYLFYDPFKVIYKYRDYSYGVVAGNGDYISIEMYIKNREKYQYNSFIFGSSRTLAYKPASWIKYLNKNANPFVFHATGGGTAYGIYVKLKFLDTIKVKIDNALIILCRDAFFRNSSNEKDHLGIKHPATSGESKIDFQFQFFKAYLNPLFLFNFYLYRVTKKYKPFMARYIDIRKKKLDTITNEITLLDHENEITKNSREYYEKRKTLFYPRKSEQKDHIQRIDEKQLSMLKEIKRILEKHKTNYKVVISPLYEEIRISDADKQILSDLFGNYLFDFSGKNRFTEDKTNYYETSHYRPNVGDSILNLIYK